MSSDINSLGPSFDLPTYPKIQKLFKHGATDRICLADEWIAPPRGLCSQPGSRLDLNKTRLKTEAVSTGKSAQTPLWAFMGYKEQRRGWGISPVETMIECTLQNLQGSNNPGRLLNFFPPTSSDLYIHSSAASVPTSPAHDPPAQRRQRQFAASHSWHQTPHSKSTHRKEVPD